MKEKLQASTPRLQGKSKLQIPAWFGGSQHGARGQRAKIDGAGWNSVVRGLALFLGGFAMLNVLGGLLRPNFDANLWWIDLRWFRQWVADLVVAISAIGLLMLGVYGPRARWCRAYVFASASLLSIVCAANTVGFYDLMTRGAIGAHVPVPLSFLLAVALGLIATAQLRPTRHPETKSGLRRLTPALGICGLCLALFPLAQMFCFGKTDYRRPADIAVVLGARVYADGRPSDALADRVRTACQLYRDGLTRKLLFSGGPGDGTVHETAAMKQMALRLGVKADDILVDEAGLNTQATVRNTERLFAVLHPKKILVVSHFYHLPRVKLAYQRDGWDVYTVPAKESYLLRQMPYNMAREVAALWVYYLRPLAG